MQSFHHVVSVWSASSGSGNHKQEDEQVQIQMSEAGGSEWFHKDVVRKR